MKELKIHSNENGNLLSIKHFDKNYSDRNYFISIIESLINLTNGVFYTEASRPNYDITDLLRQLKGILSDNCNFRNTDFEILFWCWEMGEKVLGILPTIWDAYEHVSLCFFIENTIEIDIKRKPWYEITTRSKSFVLFKGVEEGVIWIGKSNELKFSLNI